MSTPSKREIQKYRDREYTFLIFLLFEHFLSWCSKYMLIAETNAPESIRLSIADIF